MGRGDILSGACRVRSRLLLAERRRAANAHALPVQGRLAYYLGVGAYRYSPGMLSFNSIHQPFGRSAYKAAFRPLALLSFLKIQGGA